MQALQALRAVHINVQLTVWICAGHWVHACSSEHACEQFVEYVRTAACLQLNAYLRALPGGPAKAQSPLVPTTKAKLIGQ